MAQVNSIFVTPSTTLVQVSTLQNSYTAVILSTIAYTGQSITVLNTLSNLDILTKPIVVSTVNGLSFTGLTTSTLIQQPQGYVTAQSILPNQWVFLNSYPFRDQGTTGSVRSVVASTLYTAVNSTILDTVSSLTVENLIVSGNFTQTAGLILNTSVSSIGDVYVLSTMTVIGSTFFSTHVSSLGYVLFGSNLTVDGDFTSLSSVQISSFLTVSTSLYTRGSLFAPSIQLQGGLRGSTLEVQASTPVAVNLAGSLLAHGNISTFSSFFLGGSLQLSNVFVGGNISSLSSMVVNDSMYVSNKTEFEENLTLYGKLGIGGNLDIGDAFQVQNILTTSNLYVNNSLQSLSTLSTNFLNAEQAYIQGNLVVVSSPFVSTQTLTVGGSLGFQNLSSFSTLVGGNLSTSSDLVLGNGTYIGGKYITVGKLSTISSLSTLQDVYVLGSMSIGKSLVVSGGMTVAGNLSNIYTSFNTLNNASTVIQQDLSVTHSLYVTNTVVLSSIVVPSTVLAYNFITSSLTTGYRGIADTVNISSLQTSSLTTGGLLNAAYTMDMANTFQTRSLSTFLLSSLAIQVGPNSNSSTSVQTTSSFGILTTASLNTFDVNTYTYTLSNTYVGQNLSSLLLYGNQIQGTFVGDGSLLTNVNYPAAVSTLVLSTTSIVVEKGIFSSFLVSSGTVTDTFIAYSTLRVGDFNLYGNANNYLSSSTNSNYMFTVNGLPNLIALNNMYCYGDAASLYTKQVIVNPELLPALPPTYALGVGQTLQLNNILSPEFHLLIDTYYGQTVVAGQIGSLVTNTMNIESGVIGRGNGTFFLPESVTPLSFSTNTIQPNLSTLSFNSTLIVDNQKKTVGINTKPFYTLDVHSDAYAQTGILVIQSTIIQSQLHIGQQLSSIWLGVTSNQGASNILYSPDNGSTWDYFTPSNPSQTSVLLNVAYNGGRLETTRSNTLVSQKIWLAAGAPSLQYYRDGATSWLPVTTNAKLPQSNSGIAYNGKLWVNTGINTNSTNPSIFPPMHWSSDGITWYGAESGGFTWDGASATYGGNAVAWNGSLWVVVGIGASLNNTILYSGDGKNWSNALAGGFLYGGYGVCWTGSTWVATGENGGNQSFLVSTDGMSWTTISGYGFTGIPAQRGNALASDGKLTVAVGTYASGPSASIQYSSDGGYTWNNASGSLYNVSGQEGFTVVWNGACWLAGGTTGIRKSLDGITWTQPTSPLASAYIHGLAYASNAQPVLQIGASNYTSTITSTILGFNVACGIDTGGNKNCLRYSYDGINWSNSLSGYFQDQGRAAAYNQTNRWVAAGKGATATTTPLLYSGTGINWSNCSIGGSYDPDYSIGTSLAFGGGYWVATMDTNTGTGTDTLFYSSDGLTWSSATAGSQFTVAGYGVAYGNGRYTAVGEGADTILYSQTTSPPNTWANVGITNSFDAKGRGIVYGASTWVAVGEDAGGKTIKYSTDQQTWNDVTGPFSIAGYGIDYNGSNLWVAVGLGGGTSNILYSGDVTTWSNVTAGAFAGIGYGVRYNQGLQLWIAAGYDTPGVNTLKYSGDGSNWSNATGGFDSLAYGIGVASNTVSTQVTFLNQLRFLNTPGPWVTTRDTVPNISYTSTSISLMDTLTVDRFKNVSIQSQPSPLYRSTFYDSSLMTISTFVSTQATQVAGYFLSATLV